MSEAETSRPTKTTTLPIIPLAGRGKRLFCAALDFIVIYVASLGLLTRYIWPKYYPETLTLLEEMNGVSFNQMMSYAPEDLPQNAMEGLMYFLVVLAMVTWIYFVLSETFARGGSLGKAVFGLRVISLRGAPPNPLEIGVRASIKAVCFLFAPYLIILNILVMLLNRQRRALHDMMARTIVVAARLPQKQKPKAEP